MDPLNSEKFFDLDDISDLKNDPYLFVPLVKAESFFPSSRPGKNPKRPSNKFMIFKRHFIEFAKSRDRKCASNMRRITKMASDVWHKANDLQKAPFVEMALRVKNKFVNTYPDYSYRSVPKNTDFRQYDYNKSKTRRRTRLCDKQKNAQHKQRSSSLKKQNKSETTISTSNIPENGILHVEQSTLAVPTVISPEIDVAHISLPQMHSNNSLPPPNFSDTSVPLTNDVLHSPQQTTPLLYGQLYSVSAYPYSYLVSKSSVEHSGSYDQIYRVQNFGSENVIDAHNRIPQSTEQRIADESFLDSVVYEQTIPYENQKNITVETNFSLEHLMNNGEFGPFNYSGGNINEQY